MANKTILSKVMDADVKVPNLKILKQPEKWTFKVDVDFDDKVFKLVEKDTIMLDDMNKAAQKVYDQTATTVKQKYGIFEKQFQLMVDKGAPEAQINTNIAGFNTALENDRKVGQIAAQQVIEAIWKEYGKKKKEYLKYKIKIGATIFGAAASLAVSIGLMASSPFHGGLGAAVGIIGMVKSAVVLAKEIGSAWIEIETSQNNLKKYMTVVEVAAKKGKAAAKANEYSAAVIKQFLGDSQPSIKGCDSQLKTIVQKLTGVEVKTHDAGINLNGILDKQEKLRAEFMKEVTDKLSKHPSPLAKGQIALIEKRLDMVLASSYQAVQAGIQDTIALHERFKAAEATTKQLEERLKPLLALRGLDNTILENILYFIDLPLAAFDGNKIADKAVDLGKQLGSVAANMSFDKLTGLVLDKTLLA